MTRNWMLSIPVTACVTACVTTCVATAGRAQAPPGAQTQPGTFTVAGGAQVDVIHGSFAAPSRRGAPEARTLTLKYVRFPSTSQTPGPPIVFLAGGPGDAATRAFAGMPPAFLASLRDIADVVAFDQRGTGTSQPANPVCPPGEALPLDRPGDPAAIVAALRRQLERCLPALASRVDVMGLTTAESADDIRDLRDALGVPRVSLLAGSYGTHLALAVARRHPDVVARMALAGVEGPDDTVKHPARVDDVLATIDAAHPGFVDAIRSIASQLDREPWTKTLPNGQAVTLGLWDFQRYVADSLDTAAEIDALRAALASLLGGDYSEVGRATLRYRLPRPLNVMNLSMDCASYASPARLDAIRRDAPRTILGDAINMPLPDICDTPGLPRLDETFRTPVASDVPALLIAGTFDGRTPVSNARRVAAGLTMSEVMIVPNVSHDLFRSAAVLERIVAFLKAR